MESFTRYFADHAHIFWGLAGALAAILLVIAALALLAYFMFFPLARRLRDALHSYSSELRRRHAVQRDDRHRAMRSAVDEFATNSGISALSEIGARLEAAIASFSNVAHTLSGHLNRVINSPRAFGRVADRLADSASNSAVPLPPLPSADSLAAEHGKLRETWIKLLSCSVLLIAIISVNTGMLSQILRELGVVPRDLVFFGIPLYYVFAFMLTLVEAGIGMFFAYTLPGPDEPGRLPIFPMVAAVCALGIAGVEGFFYSQVAPGKLTETFELPGGFPMRQHTLFFLWGAILVVVLFGLGHVCADAFRRIGRSGGSFPAAVRRIAKNRDRYFAACETVEATAARLRKELDDARVSLHAAADESGTILTRIAQLQEQLRLVSPGAPSPHQLTSAEVHHLKNLAGVWFLLCVLCAVATLGLGFFAIGLAFFKLPVTAAWFAAAGLVGYFAVLGLVFPRGDLFLAGTGTRRMIVSGSAWRKALTITMALLVVLGLILLLWQVPLARYQAALWVLVLVLGGSLAAAVSQAAAVGTGFPLWVTACWHKVVGIAEALIRALIHVLKSAVCVVDLVALAFAAPVFALQRRELPSLHLPDSGPLASSGDGTALKVIERVAS